MSNFSFELNRKISPIIEELLSNLIEQRITANSDDEKDLLGLILRDQPVRHIVTILYKSQQQLAQINLTRRAHTLLTTCMDVVKLVLMNAMQTGEIRVWQLRLIEQHEDAYVQCMQAIEPAAKQQDITTRLRSLIQARTKELKAVIDQASLLNTFTAKFRNFPIAGTLVTL